LRFEVLKDARGFTSGVNFVIVDHDNQRFMTWPIPRYVAPAKAKKPRKGAVRLPPISLEDPKPEPRSDEFTAYR
jgi:hypothetical protein